MPVTKTEMEVVSEEEGEEEDGGLELDMYEGQWSLGGQGREGGQGGWRRDGAVSCSTVNLSSL